MLASHGGAPPSGSKPPSKRAEQTTPQAPQLFGSSEKFTHDVGFVLLGQPFGNEALLHEPTQVAPLHAVDPLLGAVGHEAHVLAQSIVPAWQLLQMPPLQPAGHIVPHAPQLFGSIMVFTHEVGFVLLGQGVGNEPLLHAATHVVPLHDVPPFIGAAGHVAHVPPHIMPEAHWQTPLAQLLPAGHTMPQALQLLLSVCSFTQAPLHRVVGALQLVTHAPALHVTDPPIGAAPHA